MKSECPNPKCRDGIVLDGVGVDGRGEMFRLQERCKDPVHDEITVRLTREEADTLAYCARMDAVGPPDCPQVTAEAKLMAALGEEA